MIQDWEELLTPQRQGSPAERDVGKLKGWAITNHMKFKFLGEKCQILHLGLVNPGCMYRLGNNVLESSTMERELEFLVNGKSEHQSWYSGSQEGHTCPEGML